jgi:hypothetical protein
MVSLTRTAVGHGRMFANLSKRGRKALAETTEKADPRSLSCEL